MNVDWLEKDQTVQLRAILCLLVVFAHSNNSIAYAFGPVAVSVFFLLSGYSLVFTTWNKKLTAKYVVRKFTNLLIPYFMVEILYRILYYFYDTVKHYNTWEGSINGYLHFSPPVFAGWYLEVLVVLLVLYFVAYKIAKGNSRNLMLALAGLYIGFTLYNIFYTKCFEAIVIPHFFVLGVGLYFVKDKVEKFYVKNHWVNYVLLLCPIISFLILYFFYSSEGTSKQIASAVFFNLAPAFLIYLILHVKLNNKFLAFIAKYSLWIYLVHVGFQYILMNVIGMWGIKVRWISVTFFIATLILSIILSIPLEFIFRKINKLLGFQK